MKKLITLALALVMMMSLFAGCSDTGNEESDALYTITGNYKNTTVSTDGYLPLNALCTASRQ